MKGLEFAGHDLCGFTTTQDMLLPIDVNTGERLGPPMNLGAIDLTSIVFMRRPDAPRMMSMD